MNNITLLHPTFQEAIHQECGLDLSHCQRPSDVQILVDFVRWGYCAFAIFITLRDVTAAVTS